MKSTDSRKEKRRTATTTFEGAYYLHAFLWSAMRHHLKDAETKRPGYKFDDLAAMAFAFNALEAYLNFAGERLAPEIWRDERKNFREQGFEGKIRKVFELCCLTEPDKGNRPYATVWEARKFRDAIAHAKTEKTSSRVTHAIGKRPKPWVPTIERRVSHEKAKRFAEDIGSVIETLHAALRKRLPDELWLGEKALDGFRGYGSGTTSINY